MPELTAEWGITLTIAVGITLLWIQAIRPKKKPKPNTKIINQIHKRTK